MKKEPFVIERTLQALVDKVWKAITTKEAMKQWYFDLQDFKPEVGFGFQFEGKDNDGNTFIHHCTITEVQVNKKLTYSWQYEGYEGKSFVTFELFPQGDTTTLKLTHEGLESFPALPSFAKESFAAGWTEIIGTSLPAFLQKQAV